MERPLAGRRGQVVVLENDCSRSPNTRVPAVRFAKPLAHSCRADPAATRSVLDAHQIQLERRRLIAARRRSEVAGHVDGAAIADRCRAVVECLRSESRYSSHGGAPVAHSGARAEPSGHAAKASISAERRRPSSPLAEAHRRTATRRRETSAAPRATLSPTAVGTAPRRDRQGPKTPEERSQSPDGAPHFVESPEASMVELETSESVASMLRPRARATGLRTCTACQVLRQSLPPPGSLRLAAHITNAPGCQPRCRLCGGRKLASVPTRTSAGDGVSVSGEIARDLELGPARTARATHHRRARLEGIDQDPCAEVVNPLLDPCS